MIVATAENDKIVGFVEIGMLPVPSDRINRNFNLFKKEAPYLGNVAVATTHRRLGVGTRLVRIGSKVAEKWGEEVLFVAVDKQNDAAMRWAHIHHSVQT